MRFGHVPTAGCGTGVASWARPERIAGCHSDTPPPFSKANTALIRADLPAGAFTRGTGAGIRARRHMKGVQRFRTVPDRMSTVAPFDPQPINSTEGNPVANVADPRDDAIIDLRIVYKAIYQEYQSNDGRIDSSEQHTLTLLESAANVVSTYRLREKAADAFVKVGINKYTRSLFRDADAVIAIFTPSSEVPANVVPFSGHGHSPLEAS